MSKIAQYLNEHLLGNVTGLTSLRASYASDASVLGVTPELIVYPKTTNDIRKAARFSWQLAEKGHVLSLTPRGYGGDATGGAIGAGLLLDISRHLHSILYLSTAKDKVKIAHVQPGVSLRTLHEALRWQGMTLPAYSPDIPDMTVGGAIAGGVVTYRSGQGTIADVIDRMEVVLANGDLMELGRISKREVSKKQGEQTLEGEIYRRIDELLEEETGLIEKLSSDNDNTGYRIDQVKHKDGSFDLTPLFIGSQGTLGIISEVVLKTDFYRDEELALAVACSSVDDARDAADMLRQLDPAALLFIDGDIFAAARERGNRFIFDSADDATYPSAVVYATFSDFSDKVRNRKLKRIQKLLAKRDVTLFSTNTERADDLNAIRDVDQLIDTPLRIDETRVMVCDGAYVPSERLRDFIGEVTALASKHRIKLPLAVDMMTGVVSAKTTLSLKKVSDKQKIFKLAAEYAEIVHRLDGSIAGGQAEGRLGAFAGYPQVDEAIIQLNTKIRKIFDPFDTLNPGVKQVSDIKTLVKLLKV